jgi:hypothetical protein
MTQQNNLILNSPEKTALFFRSLEHHKKYPLIDLTTYKFNRRSAIGKEVLSRRRVYLDTSFWVRFREVRMGRSQNQPHVHLYNRLKELVRAGKLICPATHTCIIEMFKQDDEQTRRVTAQVIDELSVGCAIQNPVELMRIEILELLKKHMPELHCATLDGPVKQRIWTHVTYFTGDFVWEFHQSPQEEALALQKSFDDLNCSRSLEDIVTDMPQGKKFPRAGEDNLIEELNKGKFNVEPSLRESGFNEIYLQEIKRSLETFSPIVMHIRTDLLAALQSNPSVPTQQALTKIISDALGQTTSKPTLPSFEIRAGIHAAIRSDHKRKFKKGDLDDVNHATVALPYFHHFLTEKSLAHLVTTKPLQYDKLYGCTVFSSADELIKALNGL